MNLKKGILILENEELASQPEIFNYIKMFVLKTASIASKLFTKKIQCDKTSLETVETSRGYQSTILRHLIL